MIYTLENQLIQVELDAASVAEFTKASAILSMASKRESIVFVETTSISDQRRTVKVLQNQARKRRIEP